MLSWLLERGRTAEAVDLLWTTWRFWWLHGHAGELARHVDLILAQSDDIPSHQRAMALGGLFQGKSAAELIGGGVEVAAPHQAKSDRVAHCREFLGRDPPPVAIKRLHRLFVQRVRASAKNQTPISAHSLAE